MTAKKKKYKTTEINKICSGKKNIYRIIYKKLFIEELEIEYSLKILFS